MSDKLQFVAGFHHSPTAESPDKLKFVGHFLSLPAVSALAAFRSWKAKEKRRRLILLANSYLKDLQRAAPLNLKDLTGSLPAVSRLAALQRLRRFMRALHIVPEKWNGFLR